MNSDDKTKPIAIFSGTQWEATMVKSLLANEQIESFVKDEIMGTLNPFYTSSGGIIQVKVLVSSKDFDKSAQVINEFKKNAEKEK